MQLRVDRVSKALGGRQVLKGVSLTLEEGQVACLLGASGCGKTTLLRCIAGFESVDAGSISLDDEQVAGSRIHVAPHARGVGMVFQDHALFPHLTVAQNAAFGLHRLKQHDATTRVEEVLELVGLSSQSKQFPHQLSGGQQQRAALARALSTKPRLLLLDEPFASLDRELRYRLVQDVSAILRASSTTALWVTHDAREALQAADYVGVMRDGKIVQWDSPADLYSEPATAEVATALGDCTLLPGEVVSKGRVRTALGLSAVKSRDTLDVGQRVTVLVRPEQVTLTLPDSERLSSTVHDDERSEDSPGLSRVGATVRHVWFHGVSTLCIAALEDGTEVKVAAQASKDLVPDASVHLELNAPETVVFV